MYDPLQRPVRKVSRRGRNSQNKSTKPHASAFRPGKVEGKVLCDFTVRQEDMYERITVNGLNEPDLDMVVACGGSVSSDSCLLSIYHWRNSLLADEHDQQRALRKSGMDWEWPYHRISLASHNSALMGC